MKQICTLQTRSYGEASLLAGRYPHGGAIALCMVLVNGGEPLCTFTTNLKSYGAPLKDDEFHVNSWDNESMVQDVMATGPFEDTGKSHQSGYVTAPVWRFKDASLVPPVPGASGAGKGGDR